MTLSDELQDALVPEPVAPAAIMPARGCEESRFPIEVSVGGHTLRTTRVMGELFVKSVRVNVESAGSSLTVLSHSHGVELLHITCATPLTVRDVAGGVAIPVWGRSDEPCPTPGATTSCGLTPSPTIWNGSTMTDLRERILSAAYPLFTHHPVHEVTLEQVEAAAGVTATELDGEFASLDALAKECLKRRERDWTIGLVRAGVEARADQPEGKLLAIFDVLDEWFHRDDYEACTFVNVLLEMGKDHPLGRASVEHLSYIRGLVAALAKDAGLPDAEEFAYSWHLLMKGAIINAVEGDCDAARRAKQMGRDLIARFHRTAAQVHDDPAYHVDPRWAMG